MDFKMSRTKISIIKAAYENGLHIEWYQKGDYYRYALSQSTFTILRRESNYGYQKVVTWNVTEVEAKADNFTLAIRTTDGMSILFHALEGDDE